MSKAFTRESDDAPEEPSVRPLGPDLPPGVRNYVTPEGARRLHDELDRLSRVERPNAVASGDPQALHELDRRLAFVQRRVEVMEVVDPAAQSPDEVRFGATVAVVDEAGGERTYRLVGVDEADPARGAISWLSPIARALLGAEVGDTVTLHSPRGDEEVEVVRVSYGGERRSSAPPPRAS